VATGPLPGWAEAAHVHKIHMGKANRERFIIASRFSIVQTRQIPQIVSRISARRAAM
jgi:hypothetical protein